MAKYDPIVSEFESEEAEAAYDVWFRAQVEAALAETGPGIPHEEVMASARATIERHKNAQTDLAA
jgi:predicted esterase